MTLAEALPDWLGVAPEHRTRYRPHELIRGEPPDSRAIRRYAPLPDQFYCAG